MKARKEEAAIHIQANVRGFLCRRRFQKMKAIKEIEEQEQRKQVENSSASTIQRGQFDMEDLSFF